MKVRITFEISIEDRLAIAARYGSDRPASHSEVLSWIRSEVYATLEGMYPDAMLEGMYPDDYDMSEEYHKAMEPGTHCM